MSAKRRDKEKLARIMKAMGHPVRIRIIEILGTEGECISGDLSSQLPVAASTTSQHLAILKRAGLIAGTVDGPRRCYCLNQPAVEQAMKWLADIQARC